MNLLPIHIIGGLVGITSGTVALSARKGARLHRKSGMIFVYNMSVVSFATNFLLAETCAVRTMAPQV